MTEHSRRSFIKLSGAAAAGAAAVAVVPMGAGDTSASGPGGSSGDVHIGDSGPLLLHVSDAKSGEILIMNGENEVTYRDPELVARIVRAAKPTSA
jgi:hypothetical protein